MKTKTKIRAYILRSAAAALLILCVIVALSSGNGISNSAAGIVAGGGATVAISNSTLSGNSGDAIYNNNAVGAPIVTTDPATFIANFSAILDGSLNPNGLTTIFYFQYGRTTAYGLTTAPQTQTGNTARNVTANISSLTASTTYHFRIVASNADGTRAGSDRTFTTLTMTGPPVVITNPASNVTAYAATLHGSLDPHGLITTFHFEYGTTTSYGHTTAMASQTGNWYLNISANISGLTAMTIYHFRIIATNSGGTRVGGDRTFATLPCFPNCGCPPHCSGGN